MRISDTLLVEHVQNLSKILLHYDLHKTKVGPPACKAACYSGMYQVKQPFIMHAGSWRAGITFLCKALSCANEKQASCIKVMTWFDVITLSWAKLNHIFSHPTSFHLQCKHQHAPLPIVKKLCNVSWDKVAKLDHVHLLLLVWHCSGTAQATRKRGHVWVSCGPTEVKATSTGYINVTIQFIY